jgi:hypothetical protein
MALSLLDAREIPLLELLTLMIDIDVVAKRAIATSEIWPRGTNQNPWREPMKEVQSGVRWTFGVNLTSNGCQSLLREE